jgi:hypothetical protein
MKPLGTGGNPQEVKTAINILNEFIADDIGMQRNRGKEKTIYPFFRLGGKIPSSGDFHEIQELRKAAIQVLDSKGVFDKYSVSFRIVSGMGPAASELVIEKLPGEPFPELRAIFRDFELASFFAIAYLIRYSGSKLYLKQGYKMVFETAFNFFKLHKP